MTDLLAVPGVVEPNIVSKPILQAGWLAHSMHTAMAATFCAITVLLCGGCQPHNVVEIQNPEQFRHEVLDSDQPVLVDFYKDGCPTCLPLDPVFEQLATEYRGRAKIARFKIMTAYWTFPYWKFKQEHQIYAVPEAHLFYKGAEVKRWYVMYLAQPYRDELDKLVPRASGVAAVPATPVKDPMIDRIP